MKKSNHYSRSDAKDAYAEMNHYCNYCKEDGHKIRDCLAIKIKEQRKHEWVKQEEVKKKNFEMDFPPLVAFTSEKNENKNTLLDYGKTFTPLKI